MGSIHKVVGVSCGVVLCLGLSAPGQGGSAAFAADDMNAGQSSDKRNEKNQNEMGDQMKGGHLENGKSIKGEVLRVEDDNYFVQAEDGKEVRLHTDHSTQKAGDINQGDRIDANVNALNYVLSIRAESTDRRNEKADCTTDSTCESGKTGSVGQ
jgi:hypothetical protein